MKTKQLLLTLLAFLLPLSSLADVWQDPETKVNYEYTVGKREASVKAGKLYIAGSPDVVGDINLLSKISIEGNEYTVTSIGKYAFYNRDKMTSVNIPEGITSIRDYAFDGCDNLTNVIIPSSVDSTEFGAFYECTGLRDVTLSEGITYIGNLTFGDCTSLASITIPESVISIGGQAFRRCNFTTVKIPQNVTSIGENPFNGCPLVNIFVDEKNTNFDSRNNCNAIIKTSSNALICGCRTTDIPSSVYRIDDLAFSRCKGLTSIVILNFNLICND